MSLHPSRLQALADMADLLGFAALAVYYRQLYLNQLLS